VIDVFCSEANIYCDLIICNVNVFVLKVIGADHDMQKMIEKYEENRDQILNPFNMQQHL